MSGTDFRTVGAQLAAPMRRVHVCQRYAEYVGSLDEARSTVLLRGMPLPGEPGAKRKTVYRLFVDGRDVKVERRGERRIRVLIYSTRDERELEQAREERKRASEELTAMAAKLEAQSALIPKTRDAFCKGAREALWGHWRFFKSIYLNGVHAASGFGYSQADVEQVTEHILRALDCLEEPDEEITFDQGASAPLHAKLAELRARAAELDPSLQDFLAAAMPATCMEAAGGPQ